MNILLTGSKGFIGSYFLNKYGKEYKIHTFSFLHDSWDNLDLSKIDVIIHLSALVHQMHKINIDAYEDVNVGQTIRLAKSAKQSGVKHFIFMSSIKVYGEETEIAYTEKSLCQPQDAYGKSKLKAEEKLLLYEDKFFSVSIIRTPLVYGEGVKANMLNLIHLIQNIRILPFGDIDNKRSMVYVGNLCAIINQLIKMKQSGVFLASDDEAYSTKRFIYEIAEASSQSVYLIKLPFFRTFLRLIRPNVYKRLYQNLEVNNTYTKQVLNFKNPYSTKEGIILMIQKELEE